MKKCSISLVIEETVVLWEQAGKEFPDMRQNEREIKFIRVGDAVRTAGQLKGELTLGSLLHFYTQGTKSRMGSCRSFADWMRHTYWVEERVRQIPSPYRVGVDTGILVRRA